MNPSKKTKPWFKTIGRYQFYNVDNRLIVWLDGGTCQIPHTSGLGKALNDGKINPPCSVLVPWVSGYYKSANGIKIEELKALIDQCGDFESVAIVGWSNGSDAVARLVSEDQSWSRVCLISNYTKQWDGIENEIDMPVRVVLGAIEKSASHTRDWSLIDKLPNAKLFRVPPYDHLVGQKIWLDERYDLLGWLCGDKEEITND